MKTFVILIVAVLIIFLGCENKNNPKPASQADDVKQAGAFLSTLEDRSIAELIWSNYRKGISSVARVRDFREYYLARALEASMIVNDGFLERVEAGLSKVFQNDVCDPIRKHYVALREGKLGLEIEADRLDSVGYKWFDDHPQLLVNLGKIVSFADVISDSNSFDASNEVLEPDSTNSLLSTSNAERKYWEAAKHRRIAELRSILDAHPEFIFHYSGLWGYSLLHVAALTNSPKMAELAISKGLTVDTRLRSVAGNMMAPTPLFLAIDIGQEEIFRYLLTMGANPSQKNDLGHPILGDCRSPADVFQLCSRTSPNDCIDSEGDTPLHLAAYRGDFDVFRALLLCGAKLWTKNYAGKTPLDVAKQERHSDIVRLIDECNTELKKP